MILSEMTEHSKYCVIGIPDHQGVINVGGRIGADQGPREFRRFFKPLIPENTLDCGDVAPLGSDLVANLETAAQMIAKNHAIYKVSGIVGGGHDHGYSHLLGIKRATKKAIGCINIDSHLDMRKPNPLITSGSPFYLALENGTLSPQHLHEYGIQAQANHADLWKYARTKGVRVTEWRELRSINVAEHFKNQLEFLAQAVETIVLSFDLDAVAEAYAPGVSAPQSEGFTPSQIFEIMEIAGAHPQVVSLGIFELNPLHDPAGATARLAATAMRHFLHSKSALGHEPTEST